MHAYTAGVYRLFSILFSRLFHGISLPCSQPDSKMAAYTCTVSVQAGKAPEDAKAHHVKDKSGRLVIFSRISHSYRGCPFFSPVSQYILAHLAKLYVPESKP